MRTKADLKAAAFDVISKSIEWWCEAKPEYVEYYVDGVIAATEAIIDDLESVEVKE